MEVTILEVCKVTPSPYSPADDICLPLTFFDLFNTIFQPVEHLFFYEAPVYNSHSILLAKLKNSLSLTLRYFLPAAGYLVWPCSSVHPVIQYKGGDGVVLTVTQSEADFNHLSGKKFRNSKSFEPLIARLIKSETQVPLIAFNITLFSNKGICIGVTGHHSLFDSTSLMLLMNSWAYFVRCGKNRGLGQDLTPVFDRKNIRERYQELESSCLEYIRQIGVTLGKIWSVLRSKRSLGVVRGTFVLSNLDIMNLKRLVNTQLENNKQVHHVSTFAAAYAYVVLCLVKVKPPKNNEVNVSFAFECRDRLKPPLPMQYFGNCVGTCNTYFNAEELSGSNGMALIVSFISETTKRLNDNGPLKGAEEWLPNIFRSFADKETLRVYVAGSSRFEYQSVDFGWGRPRKADISSIDGTGGVVFTQGGNANKGGIEVDLSLNEYELEKFAYGFHQGLSEIRKNP